MLVLQLGLLPVLQELLVLVLGLQGHRLLRSLALLNLMLVLHRLRILVLGLLFLVLHLLLASLRSLQKQQLFGTLALPLRGLLQGQSAPRLLQGLLAPEAGRPEVGRVVARCSQLVK